jgi:hypothetical protein
VASRAKCKNVIRVTIPIDIGIIGATGSEVFARATPMRIDQLIVLAVHEALGMRAPQDKRERALQATLGGFTAGHFILDVDGRLFTNPNQIVVCTESVTLRFFATESGKRALPDNLTR